MTTSWTSRWTTLTRTFTSKEGTDWVRSDPCPAPALTWEIMMTFLLPTYLLKNVHYIHALLVIVSPSMFFRLTNRHFCCCCCCCRENSIKTVTTKAAERVGQTHKAFCPATHRNCQTLFNWIIVKDHSHYWVFCVHLRQTVAFLQRDRNFSISALTQYTAKNADCCGKCESAFRLRCALMWEALNVD